MGGTQTLANLEPTIQLRSWSAPIIERAPLPIVEVQGSAHLVVHANSAACRLLGKTSEELTGKSFAEIVEGGDKCVPILDQVCQMGAAMTHAYEEDSTTDPVCWLFAMWPALDANARSVGVIIQLTRVASQSPNAAAINEALLISGLRQHELTEKAQELNEQLHKEIIEHKRTEETLRQVEHALTTQATRQEQLVQERTAELIAANQQLETFVYSIAHDLRAPLRAMQGFASILIEEAGPTLSHSGQDLAGRISESAQFMDALLSDLLAFSRISQERMELFPVELEPLVRSALAHSEKEILEKNAQIEISGPWPAVLAHSPILAQVLTNLVSNALKFVVPGTHPVLRMRAELMSGNTPHGSNGKKGAAALERGPGNWVRVWVEDKGIGIVPEHQKEVFKIFNRLHGEKYPGTGVGLAIVQKGIERMGGRVGLESSPSQGSRFWFELRQAGK
jgi:signal transduction histidine kinase